MEKDRKPGAASSRETESRGAVERAFESFLWSSRFIVLLAVVSGLLGALLLFVLGAVDIVRAIVHVFPTTGSSNGVFGAPGNEAKLVGEIIGAIDYFLIATVTLLFSFGMYELFISRMEIARRDPNARHLLEIRTLDDLKNKIVKLIIIVLIVLFFKRVLEMSFQTPLEMLFLAGAILGLAAAVYFLRLFDSGR